MIISQLFSVVLRCPVADVNQPVQLGVCNIWVSDIYIDVNTLARGYIRPVSDCMNERALIISWRAQQDGTGVQYNEPDGLDISHQQADGAKKLRRLVLHEFSQRRCIQCHCDSWFIRRCRAGQGGPTYARCIHRASDFDLRVPTMILFINLEGSKCTIPRCLSPSRARPMFGAGHPFFGMLSCSTKQGSATGSSEQIKT